MQRARSRAAESEVHMTGRFCVPLTVLVVIVLALGASIPADGQTAKDSTQTWTPARLADGQPNIQGMWNSVGATHTPLQLPAALAGRANFSQASSKPSCRREPSAGPGRLNGRAPPPARTSTRATSRMHRIGSIRTGASRSSVMPLRSWWNRRTGEFLTGHRRHARCYDILANVCTTRTSTWNRGTAALRGVYSA